MKKLALLGFLFSWVERSCDNCPEQSEVNGTENGNCDVKRTKTEPGGLKEVCLAHVPPNIFLQKLLSFSALPGP